MENNKLNQNQIAKYMQMPLLPIKNIVIGSIGTVIPWIILLFIVGYIIVI